MSTSWLQRQRKQTLLDLSQAAGLPQDEDARKDDIVEALHTHLQQNTARLSGNSAFDSYYGTRRTSPVKRETVTTAVADGVEEVKSVVKGRGRRPTKVKPEADEDPVASSPLQTVKQATSSALTRVSSALTPRSSSASTSAATARARQASTSLTAALPGPPSPSALADAVEVQSHRAMTSLRRAYTRSSIPASLTWARETCSTLSAIQLTFLFLEGFALHRALIQFKYFFDFPAHGMGKTSVYLPDLFVLLTSEYWAATTLWTATSVALPAAVAWLFNLSRADVRRHQIKYAVDPLMFNIAKAIITYAVYARGVGQEYVATDAILTVNHAVYGGYAGILTGCGVGILASLYDAALRK